MRFVCYGFFLLGTLGAQAQVPSVTTVRNFGNGTALSPAAYAFVFGTNLGNNPQVFFGTAPCQIFGFTDTVVSIQIPSGTPTGTASLTVQTTGGTSAAFPIVITPTSPVFTPNTSKPPPIYFFDATSVFVPIPTPSPGQRVYFYLDGVGPARPPVPPQILIDGNDVPVLSAITLQGFIGAEPNATLGDLPAFSIQIPSLPGGPHTLEAVAGSGRSGQVPITILARGLFTSQTGLTFNASQGGPSVPSQSFSVLSGQGSFNFSLTTSTLSGGAWLSATPSNGTSVLGTGGVPIQVVANPSGLAIGTYYGTVAITSPDVPNSPQLVTVVLVVAAKAGPSIDKTGAIFVGTTGGSNPPAQTITAFNPGVNSISFTSSLQGASANLFTVTPATATLASGKSQPITIQPSIQNLPTGIYTAKQTLSFSDGTVRTVNLLLVDAAGAGTVPAQARAAASCTPTKLLPVFTLLGDTFSVPAAFPTSVEVTIVDDCGNPLNSGNVILTFSNGDAPLRLDPNFAGAWTTTWPPGNPRSPVVLTVTASKPEANLTGVAQVSGGVTANPQVPLVSAGGVVETAAYGAPVAPGNLVSIFGANLSTSAASAALVPLPNQLVDTSVLIDGQNVPMFYTSSGQVNAVIPYGLTTNAQHQLIVQRGASYSVPQTVQVGSARPGVFTIDASGTGQGHIYKIDTSGNQILADKNAPAKAGDTLVVYCSGFGAVNPPLTAGTVTPLTFLTNTVNTLTATIGGRPAAVNFSGLTPGSVGLYQANLVVPAGLPNSDTTALILTISGQDSAQVTLAVHQ